LLRMEWKKRRELVYAMSLISLRGPKGKGCHGSYYGRRRR
jgi:hypothetical protein